MCSDCSLPPLPGVLVEGERSGDSWVGSFSCAAGSLLVGQPRLKCRAGVWSGPFPVCTGQGRYYDNK